MAVVGFRLKVMVTLLELDEQVLLIVQAKVYVLPGVPVKVVVGFKALVKLPPLPETIDHKPVPTVGVLPAKVTEDRPHVEEPVWFVPALAVVGEKEVTTADVEITEQPASFIYDTE